MTRFSFFWLRWDWMHLAKISKLRPKPPLPYISDKIARDIGLDPADLARINHKWPSEDTYRCRF